MVGNVTRENSSMGQPLWLLNFLLLIELIFAVFFIFSTSIKIPQKQDIFPQEKRESFDQETKKLDPTIIYKNDLFGTLYQEPEVEKPKEVVRKVPTPPASITIRPPRPAPINFLEPLPITLTGIIFFDDKYLNRAIIVDNRKKTEAIYKYEDEIEDAQIIKILKDRVILLRSNSQQEILFLKKELSETNENLLSKNWSEIVKKEGFNQFSIDASKFARAIKNLSELIYELNLKTAIQNSKPVGVLVGELGPNSLALNMGLNSGDIIESINNMPLVDQNQRLSAYNNITNTLPSLIEIKIRNQMGEKVIKYTIGNFSKAEILRSKTSLVEDLNESEIKENHQKYANALKDVKLRDKEKIFKYKKTKP